MSDVFDDSVATFLGPVLDLLADPTVSEVMINGPDNIYVERKGLIEKTTAKFDSEQALQAAVRNIAQFVGRRIGDDNLQLDARLPNGSRVHAVLPPVARQGTTVAIRKFQGIQPTLVDLVQKGSISKDAARFLDICIFLAKNVIVSGGTGSGKTTLLNILGSRIPKHQRIIVMEDASELKIPAEHTVYFETRHADSMGNGQVTIRDLIFSALRLRPDRIIVGEVRGGEAMELVTAMNTGHGGSMGTVHANSPTDALVRLETLCMMGDSNVPVLAIRQQIASALNLVVQAKRLADGTRKVVQISEVVSEVDPQGRYVIRDLFKFVQKGKTKEGAIVGEMVPTGEIPSFFSEITTNQLPFPRERFTPPSWYLELLKKSVA